MPRTAASIEAEEIARFSRHAGDWWNPDGAFRPLHRLNPVRLDYVRDRVCGHFRRDPAARQALKGLTILDVGCGGGLLSEPLARMGGKVTGLDASKEAIAVAQAHAKAGGLVIDYRIGGVEDLVRYFNKRGASPSPLGGIESERIRCPKGSGWDGGSRRSGNRMAAPTPHLTSPQGGRNASRYDVITALEIAEHVADLDSFLAALARLLKPGGLLILSTLNRTPKSFLLGIVAAEYILGWVPRGTHDWKKFIRPSELAGKLEANGLRAGDLTGLVFNPLRGEFELRAGDVEVNYMVTAMKA